MRAPYDGIVDTTNEVPVVDFRPSPRLSPLQHLPRTLSPLPPGVSSRQRPQSFREQVADLYVHSVSFRGLSRILALLGCGVNVHRGRPPLRGRGPGTEEQTAGGAVPRKPRPHAQAMNDISQRDVPNVVQGSPAGIRAERIHWGTRERNRTPPVDTKPDLNMAFGNLLPSGAR